jgi:hypothetical protein
VKYLMTWRPRRWSEDDISRRRELFKRWRPPEGLVFHQFVTRLDGDGGYAIVESDRPEPVLDAPARFCPWFEFSLVPVMDILDSVPVFDRAEAFRADAQEPPGDQS